MTATPALRSAIVQRKSYKVCPSPRVSSLPRCGLISNRGEALRGVFPPPMAFFNTSQSLLNRDNPTLAYPTHPQRAVDAYHLTRQSGVQFRRIEPQVETGRTACEGLHV